MCEGYTAHGSQEARFYYLSLVGHRIRLDLVPRILLGAHRQIAENMGVFCERYVSSRNALQEPGSYGAGGQVFLDEVGAEFFCNSAFAACQERSLNPPDVVALAKLYGGAAHLLAFPLS